MKRESKIRQAAMGALVAAALVVGAGQASASLYRFPADGPSKMPGTRARIVEDGSGGWLGRLKIKAASLRLYRDSGWEGIQVSRLPAKVGRRD